MKTQRIYVYLKEENFRFSSRGSALALMVMKTLMVLLIVMIMSMMKMMMHQNSLVEEISNRSPFRRTKAPPIPFRISFLLSTQ